MPVVYYFYDFIIPLDQAENVIFRHQHHFSFVFSTQHALRTSSIILIVPPHHLSVGILQDPQEMPGAYSTDCTKPYVHFPLGCLVIRLGTVKNGQ